MGRRLQFTLDGIALSLAFFLAYMFRFDFELTDLQWNNMLTQWPLVLMVQFGAMGLFGIYSFIWKYIGMGELSAFVKAGLTSLVALLALRYGVPTDLHFWRIPLSVILMDTILASGAIVALRVTRRSVYERFERQRRESAGGNGRKKSVLLIGAGQAGILAAREIQGHGDGELDIKGFLDDDPLKTGAVIGGIKVLGTTEDLSRLAEGLALDHVIITIAHASREKLGQIVRKCEQLSLKARIIPDLFQLLGGHLEVSRIRDVDIEDLLGREAVRLNEDEVGHFLSNKVVMVTGAGGSIGSELARQVARIRPSRLLLVERAEFALFDIHRELVGLWPGMNVEPLVADICDEPRMAAIFEKYRPSVVFHAAAHKHVPMMETNPTEAVKNNVLGTKKVAALATQYESEAFVMISTDKAVRPTSVMGASKRMAELVVQSFRGRGQTRFVAVRFGNVLGSAGSVIPIFKDQIKKGGPVTVTHPDMVRYFMTIPEAAQLVMQAGAMGQGGEIFVLDMGEPVRILDMARDMIRLSGFEPDRDIKITFTGVRPGEKLFEELETDGEDMAKTRHPKILIGKIPPQPTEVVENALSVLSELVETGSEQDIRKGILNLAGGTDPG